MHLIKLGKTLLPRLFITACVYLAFVFFLQWFCLTDSVEARSFTTRYDKAIKSAVLNWWPGILNAEFWWKSQLYQESWLNPDAVSPVGARGLAQFMPRTWQMVCKERAWGAVSPHTAQYAIEGGAYYMAKLARAWKSKRPVQDRWDLARASYNAGLGNLLKAQKATGGALLYQDIIKGLPSVTGRHSTETITYVERIHRWYKEMTYKKDF